MIALMKRPVKGAPLPAPMKAILASLSILLITACASVQSQSRVRHLVGDWRYADQVRSCRYSFSRDGSFTGEVRLRAKLVSQFTGRWSIKGQSLRYTYLGDSLGRIPPGATDSDELLEVKKDSLLIQAANGDRRRYVRVR
jgi:hypothetical protein